MQAVSAASIEDGQKGHRGVSASVGPNSVLNQAFVQAVTGQNPTYFGQQLPGISFPVLLLVVGPRLA